ncbi:MAG: heparinase II/III family protein [Pseudomonadota bacterium]
MLRELKPRYTTADAELQDPDFVRTVFEDDHGIAALPTITDRSSWARLRQLPIARHVIAYAETALGQSYPALTATDYLDFYRTGGREYFQSLSRARRKPLAYAVLAECLEVEGRFDDLILDRIWAICEETSWVYPAHSQTYPLGLGDRNVPLIDLFSALDGLMLAEADHLLGDRLHPAARQRIREEVSTRNTQAFLAHDNHRWMLNPGVMNAPNWTAVCATGVLGGALYLEDDPKTLARVVAKTIMLLDRYLLTFDSKGGSAEGVTYWNFGFGLFTIAADLLVHRTAGRIDLLADPRIGEIAKFPFRTQLSPSQFVSFSDCPLDGAPEPALLHKLATTLDMPELASLIPADIAELVVPVPSNAMEFRSLVWAPDKPGPPAMPAAADYFPEMAWLIARNDPADPQALALAVKGGNNGEPHNHNDVGNFIVQWRGEPLITDLGAPVYVRDTFNAETRYTFFVNASRGHCVPTVNGLEQPVGANYRAANVDRISTGDTDGLTMDIAPAYPADAGLERLDRSVVLRREGSGHGHVEIVDTASFSGMPRPFESALITVGRVEELTPGTWRITGKQGALLATFAMDELDVRIEHEQVELRLRGQTNATKLRLIARAPELTTRIAVKLAPELDDSRGPSAS